VRRTGGVAGEEAAETAMVTVKPEPAAESPDIIVMSPGQDSMGGLQARDGQGGARGQVLGSMPYNPFQFNQAVAPWASMMQHQALGGEQEESSVVVTNVHFQATPEQLGLFFDGQCGGVVRVTILKNAHGMPKGYAYMELQNQEVARSAMNMTGFQFMGRAIKVCTFYNTTLLAFHTSASSAEHFFWCSNLHVAQNIVLSGVTPSTSTLLTLPAILDLRNAHCGQIDLVLHAQQPPLALRDCPSSSVRILQDCAFKKAHSHCVLAVRLARSTRTLQVVPKLKKPPPQAIPPPWILKSMSMLQMMPYVMSRNAFASPGSSFGSGNTRHGHVPPHVQQRLPKQQRHWSLNSGVGSGNSDVWIRGVSGPLGPRVGV
jgi:hypothetical protein